MIRRGSARTAARGRQLTLFACLPLTLAAGCKERAKVELTTTRGIGDAMIAPAAPPPAAPAPPPATAVERTVYDFERNGIPSDPAALIVSDASTAPAPLAAEPATPSRDIAAELSSALAAVASCADLPKVAAQPGGKLTISVSATVLPTGSLSRPEVKAPGQPPEAVRCVEQLVAKLKLDDDVPDAPVRVTGTTDLQVKAVGGANAGATGGATAGSAGMAPAPAPTNPDIARAPTNPDIARPEPPDFAKPEPPNVAGPP